MQGCDQEHIYTDEGMILTHIMREEWKKRMPEKTTEIETIAMAWLREMYIKYKGLSSIWFFIASSWLRWIPSLKKTLCFWSTVYWGNKKLKRISFCERLSSFSNISNHRKPISTAMQTSDRKPYQPRDIGVNSLNDRGIREQCQTIQQRSRPFECSIFTICTSNYQKMRYL